VDLEIRLSFRSASLAEETTSTLALLGLEADLDQEAVLAARAESRALDVELDLLQDRRQVLKPARLESLESRFLDGSPGHFEGVLSGHRSLVRRNALEREASRQWAGELERHRMRRDPGDRIADNEGIGEPISKSQFDIPGRAIVFETKTGALEGRRL